ncbi:MAG: AbrB/MazE/SpoVT family DNA-binding domain-containing protein [Bacillota bacterium]|nr:AbrB/MazE/SpoVT family DNA-binding domain-containing protein [Bacillota bacterium]
MIVEKTSITGKGQIQIPAKIRRAIGAEKGDTLLFKLMESGEIKVELIKKRNLMELAGSLPAKGEFPGLDEEEEKTRQKVAEKVDKKYETTGR